jgi:hypothetical protein
MCDFMWRLQNEYSTSNKTMFSGHNRNVSISVALCDPRHGLPANQI